MVANPRLINPEAEHGPKWSVFSERLQEAIENGHKVVVFSQFVNMIQTMEAELNENNIPFVSLTGQTKNRAEVVTKFNEDESVRVVFLV